MRRALALLTVASLAVAAAPAAAGIVRYQRFTGLEDVDVSGAQVPKYRLRLSYLVPTTWPSRGRPHALTREFGPLGPCRFTVRVSARAVADAAGQDAATRAARALPGGGSRLLDHGTRRNAAWRVVRTKGSSDFTGLLVRPAPSVRQQPPNGRVWLEVRFDAGPGPDTQCRSHPRSLSEQLGNALANTAVGGFDLVPR